MKCKRLIALLLICLLLLPCMAPIAQAAETDTVYVRKHVSLVYDNSGSMMNNEKNLKWSYASYAAQIFAGLLNDTDSLTVNLMNQSKGNKTVEVNLSGDRQKEIDSLRNITKYAEGGTPFESVTDALNVLVNKGLLNNDQAKDKEIDRSQQYWLVLTTDGGFEKEGFLGLTTGVKSKSELESDLEAILKKYSNLHLVYFGIDTPGASASNRAVDLRDSATLKKYANFSAVYAENQEQIVSTMQGLANRISGRYSVSDGVQVNGKEVTLQISSETSPIRNIAVLAQKTDAKLLSAVDSAGQQLTVSRAANEQYPQNSSYYNVPSDTKGAHTALITSPDGKLKPGKVTLTFSEAVNKNDLSLMYEPAVHINLTLQQKDASGNWVDIPYGEKVQGGVPIRVNYEILEDVTNKPLDAAKLPGAITENITCGDKTVNKGSEFTAPTTNTNITATISMMDGAYTVTTMRSLQVVAMADYTFEVSDALSFYPDELATNSKQYIEFKVLYQGQPATGEQLTGFTVDAGDLKGTLKPPEKGVFRFTPKEDGRAPGEIEVKLCFQGKPVALQTVTVKELVITYQATAENDLTIFSNEVTSNTKPIIFSVTRTRGTETGPLPEEDAAGFTVEAKTADGTVLKGATTYVDGKLHFITNDPNGQPGEYTVTLMRDGEALATAHLSVLKYNAQFTAEVFPVGDGKVDLLNLRKNQSALAFVIYADGVPCTGTQLEGMIGNMVLLEHDQPGKFMKLNISVGSYDGKAALIVCPTSSAKTALGAWFQKLGIATRLVFGNVKDGPLNAKLTVQAEKGTQITGTLEMTHNAAKLIGLMVALGLILLVIAVILQLTVSNLSKPRVAKGRIYYYKLTAAGSEYMVAGKGNTEAKWRLALTHKPQKLSAKGSLKLQAKDSGSFQLIGPRTDPEALISVDGSTLDHYYYRGANTDVGAFLTMLAGVPQGFRISADEVDPILDVSSLGENREPAERPYVFRRTLSSGAIFWRKTNDDKIVDIWSYIADA